MPDSNIIPLAEALRPKILADVVGQPQLVDGPLGKMVARGQLTSIVLIGPPGCGKTSMARLLAGNRPFKELSALNTGVAELRKLLTQDAGGVVFIDEIHRFNIGQQDTLLQMVETGHILLIGATTEPASQALSPALRSRVQVWTLNLLDDAALEQLLVRAEAHFGAPLPLTPEARAWLLSACGGDGRLMLLWVQQVHAAHPESPWGEEQLKLIVQKIPSAGFALSAHLLSTFHKSLRGSDVQAALYWACRILQAGTTIDTLFRRLAASASEDVGLADPQVMIQVDAAWALAAKMGWPEARLPLGQAIISVATAPKAGGVHEAMDAAWAQASATPHLMPPALTRPNNKDYVPDHASPIGFLAYDFLPPKTEPFYRPVERGFERDIGKRMRYWDGLRADRNWDTGRS